MRVSADLFSRKSLLAMAVAATVPGFAVADEAYTTDQLISIFAKDKAKVEAARKNAEATRSVHFSSNSTDPQQPPPDLTHINLHVTFEFNSDRLTQRAIEGLAPVVAALKSPELQGAKFDVDGHTDASGAGDYNMRLSARRAAAVVNYLVSQGVDRSILTPKGYGKTNLPLPDEPFNPENRRVETHVAE